MGGGDYNYSKLSTFVDTWYIARCHSLCLGSFASSCDDRRDNVIIHLGDDYNKYLFQVGVEKDEEKLFQERNSIPHKIIIPCRVVIALYNES